MFIVLEGVDGCGKTTQAKMLKNALEKLEKKVILESEPTPLVRNIVEREDICENAKLFFFLADRSQHIHRLEKVLKSWDTWVIFDRYMLSTLVYQKKIICKQDLLKLYIIPHIHFLLDIKPEIAKKRLEEKNDKDKDLSIDKIRGLRESYLKTSGLGILSHSPRNKIRFCGQRSKASIHEEILAFVLNRYDELKEEEKKRVEKYSNAEKNE